MTDGPRRMVFVSPVGVPARPPAKLAPRPSSLTERPLLLLDNGQIAPASYDMVLGLSILHLLRDRDAAIARVFDSLKPGGRFVSSTACLGSHLKVLSPLVGLGKMLGKLPQISFMSRQDLRDSLTRAGFVIDSYVDEAEGVLEKRPDGKTAMTRVTLHPRVTWGGSQPDRAAIADLHHRAHEACYIANSVNTEVIVEH